jgi:hypothetical protein
MSEYITIPGSYPCTIDEPNGGWFSQDKEGRIILRIPVVAENGQKAIWRCYMTSPESKARAARTMKEALEAPSDWATRLMNEDTFLVGKPVIVKMEVSRDKTGAIRKDRNGNDMVDAAWLNHPNAQPRVTPADRGQLSSLVRELQGLTKSLDAESPRSVARQPEPVRRIVKATDPIEELADDDIPF